MKTTVKKWLAVVLTLAMFFPALVSAQVQLQGPRNSADVYSGVVYGPIDRNDTLWRIASRYKQDSQFNVYQTMLAIYELNPQAFENKNFNTMVDGATLQLPSDRFIARMDTQRARAKAEADDRAFGRPNSIQPESVLSEVAAAPTVPEVPLVNQEDLSATKQALQRQLNSLNRQQTTQFDEIKNQVATSITSVQALLDENRRLYSSLEQVNQDISELRIKVEGDVQNQIDQQLALQKEIIDLVKQAEQRQLDSDTQSLWASLSSPVAVITLSSIFTVGVLVLFGLWLLRKPAQKDNGSSGDSQSTQKDIVDDDLVIGEMDDDAEDLMAALDREMADDDILSSDLEDGLDELGVGGTDFGDLDDMLVPDTDEAKKATVKAQVVEEDISFDIDDISLDDDDFDNQEIDLTPKKDSSTKNRDIVKTGALGTELDKGMDNDIYDKDSKVPINKVSDKELGNSDAQLDSDALSDVLKDTPQNVNHIVPRSNKLGPSQADTSLNMPVEDDPIEDIENTINETTQEFENLSSEVLNDLDSVLDEDEDLDSVIEQIQLSSVDDESPHEDESVNQTNIDLEIDEAIDLAQADSEQTDSEMLEDNNASSAAPVRDTNVEADALADVLDANDSVSDQELDTLLDEFTDNRLDKSEDDNSQSISSTNFDDSDALLADIPSLTDMGKASRSSAKNNTSTKASLAQESSMLDIEDEDVDVLADLPGLDDWLGDDDLKEDLQNISSEDTIDSELSVLADIEGADFEELLSEIDADNAELSDELKEFEKSPLKDLDSDMLTGAGLDLDSLMQDDESASQSVEDFVNVDDLLSQSDALSPLNDEDIALNLDKSLGRLSRNRDSLGGDIASYSASDDALSDQASNLDLAQVYIDMDDFEAAAEVLEEVKSKGSVEQISEANELLLLMTKS